MLRKHLAGANGIFVERWAPESSAKGEGVL